MAKVYGTITNQYGDNVPDAAITDTKVFTYSDEKGNYILEGVTGNKIQVVAAGHQTKVVDFSGYSERLDIVLNNTGGQLNEVEITAERTKKDNSFILLLVLVLIAIKLKS